MLSMAHLGGSGLMLLKHKCSTIAKWKVMWYLKSVIKSYIHIEDSGYIMTYWGTGKSMVLRGIDERAINGGTWNERN